MVTWAALRSRIRRSVLADENGAKWSDEQLLDCVGWALDRFCQHTAVASATSFSGDGSTYEFPIPGNCYEPITRAGVVALSEDDKIDYLEPIRLTPGTVWQDTAPSETSLPRGFMEWPTGTMRLGFVPKDGSTLTLYYFAYWDRPVEDASELDIPRWAEEAISLLTGAIAMNPVGVQASRIGRWDDKLDSGNPEHNPIHRQAEFFYRMYDEVLRRHPPQERENFFREGLGL